MSIKNSKVVSPTADVVSVLDDTGQQVFAGAQAIRASIGGQIKYMIHPLEDESTTSDHKINLPDTVSLSVILSPESFRDTYQEIKRIARDGVPLTVQTKSDTFINMHIESYPSEESTALFDTIAMTIGLREIETETPTTVLLSVNDVANPDDSSTIARGEQSGKVPEASIAARGLDSITEFLA